MRDLVAVLLALFLLVVALSLMATLQALRSRRAAARRVATGQGRRIIAELPVGPELTLFTEDESSFYYGLEPVPKRQIRAVRMLINGVPIAVSVSRRAPAPVYGTRPPLEESAEGIGRDRWDVAIDLDRGTVFVECGAIRDRVSQELARKIFDAVNAEVERGEARGEN